MSSATDGTSQFDDPEWIVFGGSPVPEPGVAADHGAFDPLKKLFARSNKDVEADFGRVTRQLKAVATAIPKSETGFEVSEMTVELGFSASGRLVFIAEAGVEATVSVTFRRKGE
jgi:hypothetical protein